MLFSIVLALVVLPSAHSRPEPQFPTSTGRYLTPAGRSEEIGGFPVNAAISPSGRWIATTNTGIDERLSILDARTGKVTGSLAFNGAIPGGKEKDGLYWGLCFRQEPNGRLLLFASHGASDRLDAYEVSAQGTLSGPVESYKARRPGLAGLRVPTFFAGAALDSTGRHVYALGNQTLALSDEKGDLMEFDRGNEKPNRRSAMPGFPLDLVCLTSGPNKDRKLYVTSEREGTVSVVNTETLKVVKTIRTGEQPTHLLLDRSQRRLFVANTNSDTVSVIDTRTDSVVATLVVRPPAQRGMPGADPLGMALSADEGRLYVALSDLNAIAVLDLRSGRLLGLVPTGWYPTAVVAATRGLVVTAAKGLKTKFPNLPPAGSDREAMMNGDSGPNIRAHLHGVATFVPAPTVKTLLDSTRRVVANNLFARIGRLMPPRPQGVKHVVYIIKENRTYDQIFGDEPTGVRRSDLCIYGRDVTPNEHALAERFVLFDNFYACAEMSADGWSWSTAGIASEYVERNAQYDYSGRKREYDYEGQNNGTPADARGLRNVNDPPGGYLWDNALRHKVEFRDYGMYIAEGVPIRDSKGRPVAEDNSITMRAFKGRADLDYRMFDLDYAESDAWDLHNATYPKRRPVFGSHRAKSRIEEWRRDYGRLVKAGKVPPLMFVRFGNNHTAGTSPGSPVPEAMIADNDYAVGQLVDTISHGPLWKSTAIVIVEDDAQGGYDHVDGHRSIAFVISPWVRRSSLDSRYFNTDSAVRTVEWLLGLPPANQFTATASPLNVFTSRADNSAPYNAILPPKRLFRANTRLSYRAKDSARLFHTYREESASDLELADILWGAAKGPKSPRPGLR